MGTYAGVVRVSHMGARKPGADEFHSERDQIAAMRDAIDRLGGRLKVLPSELDVSGGLPLERRRSLLAAVEGVECGMYAGVVVAYQSRLGRDVEQEEAVWRRVEKAGGQIILALDGIDASTVDGKMVRRIRSAINHAERDRHVERFEQLRKGATKAGIWQRRQTPIGYSRNPQTRRLVPDERASEVLDAFRDRAAGESVPRIAQRLGMTPNGVRQMFRNRVYLGELRVGDHINTEAHPAIVPVNLFESVQCERPRPPRGVTGGPALLAGLVRCCGCGHLMTRGGRQEFPSYTCPKHHSGGSCPEPASISVRNLDEFVERIARRELKRISVIEAERKDLVELDAEIARLERELSAYLTAVSAADVGAEAFAAGAKARSEPLEARRVERQALANRSKLAAFASGAAAYDGRTAEGKNTILRALLSSVLVERSGGRGVIRPVKDRVAVLAHGAPINLPAGTRASGYGIVPIGLPNGGDELSAWMLPSQD